MRIRRTQNNRVIQKWEADDREMTPLKDDTVGAPPLKDVIQTWGFPFEDDAVGAPAIGKCQTGITPLRRLTNQTYLTHGLHIRVYKYALQLLRRGVGPIHMQFRN